MPASWQAETVSADAARRGSCSWTRPTRFSPDSEISSREGVLPPGGLVSSAVAGRCATAMTLAPVAAMERLSRSAVSMMSG